MYWTPAYRDWQEKEFAPWNQEPPEDDDYQDSDFDETDEPEESEG